MISVVAIVFILLGLTVVHESGHWLAIRRQGGRVLRISIGRGPVLARRAGEPEVRLALLPLGGRIDYDGVPSRLGEVVVALGGAVANLLVAGLIFLAGALMFGLEGFAPDPSVGGVGAFTMDAVAGWFWLVPTGIVDLVVSQQVAGMRSAIEYLADRIQQGEPSGLLYLAGAASSLWASLNLIPIPGLGTDGWRALVSLRAMFGGDGRNEGGFGSTPPDSESRT